MVAGEQRPCTFSNPVRLLLVLSPTLGAVQRRLSSVNALTESSASWLRRGRCLLGALGHNLLVVGLSLLRASRCSLLNATTGIPNFGLAVF